MDEQLNRSAAVRRMFARAVVTAFGGAAAGAVCLLVVSAREPGFSLDLNSNQSHLTSGLYPGERDPLGTFAWTSRKAELALPGLDRRSVWRCSARLRGGRAAPLEQPTVDLAIDGVVSTTYVATNDYRDVPALAPIRSAANGLTLSIVSTPTFVPGPSDRRELGVQIARLECRPENGAFVFPPRHALATALLIPAAFGVAFVLMGAEWWAALTGAALLGAAQAVPLMWGLAPYSGYQSRILWIGISIAAVLAVGVPITEWLNRRPFHHASRFVAAFSAAALLLLLLALLHPSKAVVDAVFHAHRLEWVLAGRFFFTQPLPDGVRFPYAIGLYVVAAPWSLLTRDYVLLLRVVVCVVHVLAGALLYWTIVARGGDKLAGVAAVILFQFVPLPLVVIGNANLTYAFGQSLAFITTAVAIGSPLLTRMQVIGLFVLASMAFLSHVGVAPLLFATLILVAVLYRCLGGPTLRLPARSVVIATVLAGLFSVVTYYGHFTDAYRTLARVRTDAKTAAVADPGAGHVVAQAAPAMPLQRRVAHSVGLTVRALGWAMLLLTAIGMWRLRVSGIRDRLVLALAASGVVYLIFVGFRVLVPVDVRFQRYADEFIDRVNYATAFGVVILAAHGLVWLWRAGTASRFAVAALAVVILIGGVTQWIGWLR